MPVSRYTAEGGAEDNSEGDGKRGSSTEGSSSSTGPTGGKRRSKPTSKARTYRQKLKDRYAHAREDAQLAGLIETTPEESLKPERVDSSTQEDQPILPGILTTAILQGWKVPEHRKPDLVAELVAMIDNVEVPFKVKVAAFNALRLADQAQWERDHPEMVAKLRGGAGTVIHGNVIQNNVAAAATIRELVSGGHLGLIEELPTDVPSSESSDLEDRCIPDQEQDK